MARILNEAVLKVGVVADTHLPDRLSELHPLLLPALVSAGVQQILHAGDISSPAVLEQLRQVAPVTAVRGNRDFALVGTVNLIEKLDLAGVPVTLMHGHGNFWRYLVDKFYYIRDGYRFERYHQLALRVAKEARVIVFGHTHQPVNTWIDGQLYFNPGSASFGFPRGRNPGWGMLSFFEGGKVSGKLHKLHGYQVRSRSWVKA